MVVVMDPISPKLSDNHSDSSYLNDLYKEANPESRLQIRSENGEMLVEAFNLRYDFELNGAINEN